MAKQPPRTFPVSSNGDLMSRLSSFIPQIKAANEALAGQETLSIPRVDANLELDQKSDDGGWRDNNDADADADSQNNNSDMIELKLAVGDVDENPAISRLADADYDDDDDNDSGKNGDDSRGAKGGHSELSSHYYSTTAENTVLNLLKKRPGETLQPQPDSKRPLISEIETKMTRNETHGRPPQPDSKCPLITEIEKDDRKRNAS